jgi:hypothetical protein
VVASGRGSEGEVEQEISKDGESFGSSVLRTAGGSTAGASAPQSGRAAAGGPLGNADVSSLCGAGSASGSLGKWTASLPPSAHAAFTPSTAQPASSASVEMSDLMPTSS